MTKIYCKCYKYFLKEPTLNLHKLKCKEENKEENKSEYLYKVQSCFLHT